MTFEPSDGSDVNFAYGPELPVSLDAGYLAQEGIDRSSFPVTLGEGETRSWLYWVRDEQRPVTYFKDADPVPFHAVVVLADGREARSAASPVWLAPTYDPPPPSVFDDSDGRRRARRRTADGARD